MGVLVEVVEVEADHLRVLVKVAHVLAQKVHQVEGQANHQVAQSHHVAQSHQVAHVVVGQVVMVAQVHHVQVEVHHPGHHHPGRQGFHLLALLSKQLLYLRPAHL